MALTLVSLSPFDRSVIAVFAAAAAYFPGKIKKKMEAKGLFVLIIAACLATLFPSHEAHNANFELDDYWKQRAEDAQKAALEAYHPNPEDVTDGLNFHVHKSVHQSKSLRGVFFYRFVLLEILNEPSSSLSTGLSRVPTRREGSWASMPARAWPQTQLTGAGGARRTGH